LPGPCPYFHLFSIPLGLLAFVCFCEGWGAGPGPRHQPQTWGTRILFKD
jgi:hypothetical protein